MNISDTIATVALPVVLAALSASAFDAVVSGRAKRLERYVQISSHLMELRGHLGSSAAPHTRLGRIVRGLRRWLRPLPAVPSYSAEITLLEGELAKLHKFLKKAKGLKSSDIGAIVTMGVGLVAVLILSVLISGGAGIHLRYLAAAYGVTIVGIIWGFIASRR